MNVYCSALQQYLCVCWSVCKKRECLCVCVCVCVCAWPAPVIYLFSTKPPPSVPSVVGGVWGGGTSVGAAWASAAGWVIVTLVITQSPPWTLLPAEQRHDNLHQGDFFSIFSGLVAYRTWGNETEKLTCPPTQIHSLQVPFSKWLLVSVKTTQHQPEYQINIYLTCRITAKPMTASHNWEKQIYFKFAPQ